jgi:protein gp37
MKNKALTMAENTKIEWAHHTFNPWIGCTKVSPACMHCYSERDFDHRLGQVQWQWGPNGTRVLTGSENWAKPLKWDRDAQKKFEVAQAQWVSDCCWFGTKNYPEPELKQFRKRVSCASLADVFEDWQGPMLDSIGGEVRIEGPDGPGRLMTMHDVRTRLFALIDATPNLDWLLLTKRPENIRKMYLSQHLDGGTTGRIRELMDEGESKDVHPYFRRNVWLGVSVENQEYADKRIPELLRCRDLSPVLFLSCEPLLGDLEIEPFLSLDATECCPGCEEIGCNCGAIDWVIAGGESGPEARPSKPDWFRSLRDQCQTAGVPFLFKQWGEFGEHLEQRVGEVRAGRSLNGVIHDGFPVPFQQR